MANLVEAANIFRHALYLLRESGFSFAQIPGLHEAQMRFVARCPERHIVIHAAWPAGLLGVAHLALRPPMPRDNEAQVAQALPIACDDEREVTLEIAGRNLLGNSLRAWCVGEIGSRGYRVSYDDPFWTAVRNEGGGDEDLELCGFTPEGLLGTVLIYERFGEYCWKVTDFPDYWSDVPGEGWDDE